ncbi:MAG TPA: PBSX family phage terminase large subunit [Pseudonocardia sp.]
MPPRLHLGRPTPDPTRLLGTLSRAQIGSVVQAAARINVWHGAIRSGKTIASLLAWMLFVAAAPTGGELVIVGKTLQTIERNVIAPLKSADLFGEFSRHVHHTDGANTAVILGRTIHLIGANDAKSEGKLRGMTCAGAYVDEATLLPRGFWVQLLGRCSVVGSRIFATTNPDNPAHWLKTEFLDRESSLDLRAWHFTLYDNPSLTQEYRDNITAEFVGLWHKRMVLGLWVVAEGAVYESWDPDTHVVAELPRIERWVAAGIDYGTTNPFAALLLGVGADHRLYLAREWRYDRKLERQSLTDAEYSTHLREQLTEWADLDDAPRSSPDWVVVDPSAASFKVQLYRDGVRNVIDGDHDVRRGIRLTSSLLATDRLRVHESCTGFITEAPGYSWDDKAAERGEDKPIKVADHSLDGGRYAITTTEHLWRPYVDQPTAA